MSKLIDPKTFWRIIGVRAVGTAVATANGSGGPSGFLALSATHVSADPPTMLVSISRKTSTLTAIKESNSFAINYLAKGREDLAREFSGRGQRTGADRFLPGEWKTLTTGSPILIGAVGSIDCRVAETIERHDVVIALGTIVDWSEDVDKFPLTSFAGRYL